MATARKSRIPRATAVNTAVRSAQLASPYDAFSTLQPVHTLPFPSIKAAPTG